MSAKKPKDTLLKTFDFYEDKLRENPIWGKDIIEKVVSDLKRAEQYASYMQNNYDELEKKYNELMWSKKDIESTNQRYRDGLRWERMLSFWQLLLMGIGMNIVSTGKSVIYGLIGCMLIVFAGAIEIWLYKSMKYIEKNK